MTKRFAVVHAGEYGENSVALYFTQDSKAKAITAFRTLYGEQSDYTLFEQVACSEPTGSCDEVINPSREDRLLSRQERAEMARGTGE